VSAQKLAIEQERNRIAQKVHDTAGHTLTMIQSLVRLARVEWERSQSVSEEKITWYGELTQLAGERRFEKISEKEAVREGETSSGEGRMEEYLSQAQELAVEGIRELRISINQLRQGTEGELVTQGVYHLAQRVKELDVEVSVQGTDGLSYSHLSTVVYECLREAITNCLKYAHASHMDVILKFEENGLRVYIFDDGQGCQSIVEDNGLRGIRDRVTEAGGQVRILSSEGEDFRFISGCPWSRNPDTLGTGKGEEKDDSRCDC
jgi:signal transduction histidine kinase